LREMRVFIFNKLHTLCNSQIRAFLLFCYDCTLFGKNTPGVGVSGKVLVPTQDAQKGRKSAEF